MRLLGLVFALALLLVAPSGALAKRTADFTYKSTGKAVQPGVVVGLGVDGTYEDIPFKIAADDADGTAAIEVHWSNDADDFDLTVYKKDGDDLEPVGSSAGAPPATSEATAISGQGGPVDPGDYVIRVQNYAASSPDFEGSVKFTDYVPPNVKPAAALKKVKKARAGKAVNLDASGSKDGDGQIVNYGWDLDGDGSIETDGGGTPTLKHTFAAGVYHVTVRVTDNRGGRGYATRTIRVAKPAKKKKR